MQTASQFIKETGGPHAMCGDCSVATARHGRLDENPTGMQASIEGRRSHCVSTLRPTVVGSIARARRAAAEALPGTEAENVPSSCTPNICSTHLWKSTPSMLSLSTRRGSHSDRFNQAPRLQVLHAAAVGRLPAPQAAEWRGATAHGSCRLQQRGVESKGSAIKKCLLAANIGPTIPQYCC